MADFGDNILEEGVEYSVGTNDGKVFNRIVYKGTRNFAGKNIMCFETEEGSQVSINPSYYSYTIEENGQFPTPEDFNKTERSNS